MSTSSTSTPSFSSSSPGTDDALSLLRARGFVQQLTDEAALAARLAAGPLTFYAGFDPTAASLHVGHYIPLMAMAHLARAGHQAIAVLGGGTAMVGDPSGKTEMRQLISAETIATNRASIEPQVRRIIGASARIVDNAEWLLPLNYIAFLRDIGRYFSVNRMLAAEAYKVRLEKGLSFIEFNYQLLQAYDFLALYDRFGCGLQIGGDDQWGNILAGTDLIRRLRQHDAFGLTFPLLTTASGAKMGKTAAGAVWLDGAMTTPFDFFQYFVNVDDQDVIRFLKLLTFVPMDEIHGYQALVGAAIREAKQRLAYEVTKIVHGQEKADEVAASVRGALGGAGGASAGPLTGLPTVTIDGARLREGIKIVDLIVELGFAPSKSAARRLVEQGGVKVGERDVASVEDLLLPEEGGALLRVGKKRVGQLKTSE
ncbi:MAG TPA: tyrosine--tRNA ligase [Polyangia bacterium]|jgi:tyrosyl-tRNA synthetase